MARKSILFMDDDLTFRSTIADALVKAGYDVTCCDNATEAKALLQAESFDLVISDIFIKSNGDFVSDGGVTLLGWMQTRMKIPTIAITGLHDGQGRGFLQNMKELGAEVCLPKPLDQAELLDHVAKLTAKSAKART